MLGSSPLATTVSNTHMQSTLFWIFKAEVLYISCFEITDHNFIHYIVRWQIICFVDQV
jgi:hypothetical protein